VQEITVQKAILQGLRQNGFTVYRDKFSQEHLTKFGFNPKTVFDIGVNAGTPALYKAFSNTKLILIDPQREVEQRCKAWLESSDYDMEFINVAIGKKESELTLNIPKQKSKTSLLERTPLTQNKDESYEKRQVKVLPLGEIVELHRYQPPFGIKIDTEGYELEVLEGATSVLGDTEFVIAEVSVKERFVGSYRFSEVIKLMADHEFELLDILNMPVTTPRFLDCLFVNRNHKCFQEDL
jgi:FkbM family methyltransferase